MNEVVLTRTGEHRSTDKDHTAQPNRHRHHVEDHHDESDESEIATDATKRQRDNRKLSEPQSQVVGTRRRGPPPVGRPPTSRR